MHVLCSSPTYNILPSGSLAPQWSICQTSISEIRIPWRKRINKLPANVFFLLYIIVQNQLKLWRYKLSNKQPSVYQYKYVLYYYQKESSTGVQLNRQRGWFTPNSYLSRSVLIFDCLHLCEGHQNVLPRCCDMGLVINHIPEIHRPEQISISRKCYSNEITGKCYLLP
jgi:hypothetical protein